MAAWLSLWLCLGMPICAALPVSGAPPLIPPVPCREDLAIVAERYFNMLGRAAEIGVYKGAFAKNNMRTWTASTGASTRGASMAPWQTRRGVTPLGNTRWTARSGG